MDINIKQRAMRQSIKTTIYMTLFISGLFLLFNVLVGNEIDIVLAADDTSPHGDGVIYVSKDDDADMGVNANDNMGVNANDNMGANANADSSNPCIYMDVVVSDPSLPTQICGGGICPDKQICGWNANDTCGCVDINDLATRGQLLDDLKFLPGFLKKAHDIIKKELNTLPDGAEKNSYNLTLLSMKGEIDAMEQKALKEISSLSALTTQDVILVGKDLARETHNLLRRLRILGQDVSINAGTSGTAASAIDSNFSLLDENLFLIHNTLNTLVMKFGVELDLGIPQPKEKTEVNKQSCCRGNKECESCFDLRDNDGDEYVISSFCNQCRQYGGVEQRYDIGVMELAVTSKYPKPGNEISFKALLHNYSEAAAPIDIRFFWDEEVLHEASLYNIIVKPGQDFSTAELRELKFIVPNEPGKHELSARIRHTDKDINPNNDMASRMIVIGGDASISKNGPDLAVGKIYFSPNKPQEGEEIFFSTTLMNLGSGPALGFKARWYLDQIVIAEHVNLNTLAGEKLRGTDFLKARWIAQPGKHEISYEVDSDNKTGDISQHNNYRKSYFVVSSGSGALNDYLDLFPSHHHALVQEILESTDVSEWDGIVEILKKYIIGGVGAEFLLKMDELGKDGVRKLFSHVGSLGDRDAEFEAFSNKLQLQTKLDSLTWEIQEVKEKQGIAENKLNRLKELKENISSYAFIKDTGSILKEKIEHIAVETEMDKLSNDILEQKMNEIEGKFNEEMQRSRIKKHEQGMIPFKDVDISGLDSDAGVVFYSFIDRIKDLGIVRGFGDGSFGPERFVTRAEALIMALKHAGIIPAQTALAENVPFKDVGIAWQKGAISSAISEGIVIPEEEGAYFRPDNPASRGAVIRYFVRAWGVGPNLTDDLAVFEDTAQSPDRKYIEYAYQLGVASGYVPGKLFGPDLPIRRGEVAKIIANMLDSFGGKSR